MSETFINYSDLDFKQEGTDKYTVITFKDKEIKVLKYLPSIEKYNLLNTTLLQSIDDTVIINVKVIKYNGVKITLEYTVIDEKTGEVRCTGESEHCFLDTSGCPVS